jgi:hypothetical protein
MYQRERMARVGALSVISLTVAGILLMLAACVQMTAPRNVSESLAYVESQVQGVVRTCTTLNNERRITLAQAVQCDGVTRQAFTAIDLGRGAAQAGDMTRAEAQLSVVRSLLIEAEKITRSAP